jgi:hypothetical protein
MRVDGYNNVGGAPSTDPRSDAAGRVPGSQRPESADEREVKSDEAHASGDSIEISQGARELIGQAPVRPEMVERARKLLSSGLYNEKGAIEKTAEKIAASFSTDA